MKLKSTPTKTQMAKDKLSSTIFGGEFKLGDKLPGTVRLSSLLGVSRLTVNRALHALKDEGILECRHGSGTYVVGLPLSGKSIAILTELDPSSLESSYYHMRLINRTKQHLEDMGFTSRLYIGRQVSGVPMDVNLPMAIDEMLADNKIFHFSSVVLISTPNFWDEWNRKLVSLAVPIISPSFGNIPEVRRFITLDYSSMLKDAARLIASAGRRRPAIFTNSQEMLEMFRKAASENSVETRDEFTYMLPTGRDLDRAGYDSFHNLYSRSKKPDAILFTDDTLFMGAKLAIAELGISVPRDLMVLTHSNKDSATMIQFETELYQIDPDMVAKSFANSAAELALNPVAVPYTISHGFEHVHYTPPKKRKHWSTSGSSRMAQTSEFRSC